METSFRKIIRYSKFSLNSSVRILFYLVLIILFIIPLLWMVLGSLRPETELFANLYPFNINTIIPEEWTFRNYRDIFGISPEGQMAGLDFLTNVRNSFIVASAVLASGLVFNILAAYALARLDIPFKGLLVVIIVGSMLLPLDATVVPLYIVVRQLNIPPNFLSLILPWYASPFFVFAMMQFFKAIPKDLDEAATLDGASRLGILWHVIIPNSLPGIVTLGMIEFQFAWNLFYWPLIAVSRREYTMLQVAIAAQSGQQQVYWGRTLAGATIASLPLIIVFLLFQRYYVETTAMTGVKG